MEEQGIEHELDEVSQSLAEHLINKNTEPFTWDDGKDSPNQTFNLSFSDDEIAELKQHIETVIEELPEALNTAVRKTARQRARDLRREWPYREASARAEVQHFRDNLNIRWGKGLRALKMLLLGGREIGDDRLSALQRSKAKKNLVKREVLIILHVNACRVMNEIILLLESGFSDGALARWRTLYEITVVAEVIAAGNDDLANRYLEHSSVAAKKEVDLEERHGRSRDKLEIEWVNQRYSQAIDLFGEEFRHDYGWASQILGKKKPSFRDLEEAASMKGLPPEYKAASYAVHAGVTGMRWNFAQFRDDGPPVPGASNAGLDFPAKQAAFTFTRVTALLIHKSRRLENLVAINMLLEIRDSAEREFDRAARKLQEDEDAAQKLRWDSS